jgi:hypothetical protein
MKKCKFNNLTNLELCVNKRCKSKESENLAIYVAGPSDTGMEKITLPASNEEFKRAFDKVGATKEDFVIKLAFGNSRSLIGSIEHCKNLSELNYLGAIFAKLTREQQNCFGCMCNYQPIYLSSLSFFINFINLSYLKEKEDFEYYWGDEKEIPEEYRITV